MGLAHEGPRGAISSVLARSDVARRIDVLHVVMMLQVPCVRRKSKFWFGESVVYIKRRQREHPQLKTLASLSLLPRVDDNADYSYSNNSTNIVQ